MDRSERIRRTDVNGSTDGSERIPQGRLARPCTPNVQEPARPGILLAIMGPWKRQER